MSFSFPVEIEKTKTKTKLREYCVFQEKKMFLESVGS
jgi:hypothetical protein